MSPYFDWEHTRKVGEWEFSKDRIR